MSLILWCLHLQLRPFRFFESGLPQPADCVIVLLWLGLAFCRNPPLSPHVVSFRRYFGWFVAYVVLVNCTWWYLHRESDFLIASAYYVYNFLGCAAFIKLYGYYGKTFLKLTAGCICIALLVQFLAAMGIAADYGGRETLFFVNPNQLAYYVVLSLSVIWVCWTSRGPNGVTVPVALEVASVGCASYLVLLSQSRAGIAAVCVVMLGRVLNRKQFLVGAVIVVLAAVSVSFASTSLTDFQDRTERKELQASEELGIRGYDRIAYHREYLFFGAGEGVHERFESEHDGELHSSLGTILFSYGVVGMALVFLMTRSIVLGAGLSSLVYLAPVFIYSLTHNGLRQLEMWWLMPLIICLNSSRVEVPRNESSTKQACAKFGRSSSSLAPNYRRKPAQVRLT